MGAVNRCPKCKGWMFLDRDYYGWYAECLQCSYCQDLNEKDIVVEKNNNTKWERPLASLR